MLTDEEIADIKSGMKNDKSGLPLALRALGDAGRFNIFRLLMDYHDICVTDIAKVLDVTVSAASQQLRVLERLGIVLKMRMGQMVCYEVNRQSDIARRLVKLIKD